MKTPDLCIYHGNCADGFTAAWAVWRRFGEAVEYVPGIYGKPAPDVTGRRVLIVDFSFKADVLRGMASEAASITILDHHKTAEADLAPLLAEGVIAGEFDMNRSGARMAWDALHNDPAPMLVRHVEDRDLWRFCLPGTREIQATVFSHPYDFATWDKLTERCETDEGRAGLIAEGAAIERKHFKDIDELLAVSTREMVIGGHRVRVANLPYTLCSDAAGKLAEGWPFGATYYDNAKGERVFSLRSRDGGADVSAIAASYGGGGHAQASGFTAPPGWEGE